MGKKSEPAKPTSSYKIGDRTVANAYWNGNDYVTQFNPTSAENQSMGYLQSALPQAYKDATDTGSAEAYADKYYQNQLKDYNKAIDPQMTALKDSLITGGQIGGSTGWNKIKSFSDSYSDTIADLEANKETNALNYKNNLLSYANNLQGSMNNYYNLALGSSQNAAQNQQSAWGQNLAQFQAGLMAQQAQMSNIYGGINAAAGLGGALLGTGGIGSVLGKGGGAGLAGKTGSL